jgi:uncharacterized membrane protein
MELAVQVLFLRQSHQPEAAKEVVRFLLQLKFPVVLAVAGVMHKPVAIPLLVKVMLAVILTILLLMVLAAVEQVQ